MTRGRLARYSLWQFRDFAVERAFAVVLIGLLLGYMSVEPIRRGLGANWATNPAFPLSRIVSTIVAPVVTLAVLIALNGMISNDRKMGYYRFLFSKPVKPALYYAQVFAVHMVGVLLTMAALTGLFRLWAGPIPIAAILLYTLVVYISMGGIGFFISATIPHDWVGLAGVWIGSRLLRAVYSNSGGIRARLVQLLPPVHRVDDVANNLLSGRMAETSDLLWLTGYGLLFFALGLWVVSRRSLVT
ncbi:MAG: hypothetical protein ABR585_05890 [Gemmatimonadaceae bacterium]